MILAIKHYWKYIIALIGFVGVTVQSALVDGHISGPESVQIILSLATALTVYILPNASAGVAKYVKEITAALGFIATYLIPTLMHVLAGTPFTGKNWTNVAIQLGVAILVLLKQNAILPPVVPLPPTVSTVVVNNPPVPVNTSGTTVAPSSATVTVTPGAASDPVPVAVDPAPSTTNVPNLPA